jgi:hypothetical protein
VGVIAAFLALVLVLHVIVKAAGDRAIERERSSHEQLVRELRDHD